MPVVPCIFFPTQAYVYQNNIYLKQDPREPSIQITTNGKQNEIFNGIPDWVYEGNSFLRLILLQCKVIG